MKWKQHLIRLLSLLLIVCFLVTATGCDYLDIDRLVSVTGVAIDIEKDTGDYLITAEIARLSDDQTKPVEPVVLTGKGKTITDALEDMGTKTSGSLYYLHSSLLVFGEDAAKKGISSEIDTFMRSAQAQRVIKIAIVKESKAGEIFGSKASTKSLVSSELSDAIETQSLQFGLTSEEKLYELYNNIPAGLSDLLPAIKIQKKGDKSEAKVDGTAILDQGTLRGFLTPEESKYCLFAMGKFKAGNLSIESSVLGTNFTYRVIKCKSGSKPSLQEGRLVMEIHVKIQGIIPEIAGQKINMEQINKNGLLQDVDEQLSARIEEAVKKVQKDCRADPFNLKPQAENKFSAQWTDLTNDWQNNYRNAQVKVTSTVVITSNGLSK